MSVLTISLVWRWFIDPNFSLSQHQNSMALFNILLAMVCLHGQSRSVFASAGNIEYLTDTSYVSSLAAITSLQNKAKPRTIAVIGGGIGGTSATYFLRQLFENDVQIDLFEPETVCGRVATISFAGREYESGGSILHPKNVYATEIAQAFGLPRAKKAPGRLGLFDGTEYFLETSDWKIITFLKFIWSFGLDMFRLHWLEKIYIDKFSGIYEAQKRGSTFTSVRQLLYSVGSETFVNATEISACKLFSRHGIGEKMIDNLISSGIHVNYGQTCAVNGFVGMVSMAGIQSDLWSVRGGNKQLCSKLIKNSTVNLLAEAVQSVSFDNQGTFLVSSGFPVKSRAYDIVILATPINRDMSHMDVSRACSPSTNCPSVATDHRHFTKTVATFVNGTLNYTLFQCNSMQSCPKIIFTTRGDLFYRCIGLQVPVDYDPDKGDTAINSGIYKVFSNDSLTEAQLHTLFASFTEVKEKVWYAYPKYSPPEELTTFVLNEAGFYYISPIEWAASAIEMSILSAKNSALLAFNNWYGLSDRTTSTASAQRVDL